MSVKAVFRFLFYFMLLFSALNWGPQKQVCILEWWDVSQSSILMKTSWMAWMEKGQDSE